MSSAAPAAEDECATYEGLARAAGVEASPELLNLLVELLQLFVVVVELFFVLEFVV